jgi:basic membrane protein A
VRRIGLVLGGLVVLNLGLLLCGGAWFGRSEDPSDARRLKVGLVFDVGGLGDKSFNDAAYLGLTRAEAELDVVTRTVEPGDGSDRESALRQLAQAGFDLVIGVGFIFSDDMRAAAAQFPSVKFACIDFSVIPGQPPPPPNLVGLRFREHEGSFLVGAVAGLLTKTGKIGFVGGMQIPLIRKFEVGYRAGALEVCPHCEVFAAYAGTEPKAFADPTMGKELALAQYGRGADIIFHASGKTGTGVFNAARQQGKMAIGVDADQYGDAPCCVITSMRKGVDVSVYDTIRQVAEGRFVGGVKEFGLAEGGVDYVYDDHNRGRIGEAAHQRIEAIRRRIVEGKLQVPFE